MVLVSEQNVLNAVIYELGKGKIPITQFTDS